MAVKKKRVEVAAQERIATDVYSLWIKDEEMTRESKPGQFLSLYTEDASKLLPRPISICEIDKDGGRLRMVYRVTGPGTGTDMFSQLKVQDTIEVMGPLGNGFPLESSGKALLIGGGIGVPPMLELSKQLEAEVQIAAGYKEQLFLVEELRKNGEVFIATEDGSSGTKGTVLDAIQSNHVTADVIFACGPTPMLRAVKSYAQEQGILCYVSMEQHMACGMGACLACVCKTKETDAHSNVKNRRICKDGPVFLASEVEL